MRPGRCVVLALKGLRSNLSSGLNNERSTRCAKRNVRYVLQVPNS